MDVVSLIISIIALFYNCIRQPYLNRITKAEDNYIRLIIRIIDDYGKYQTLSSYNGTPLNEAKKIRNRILTNCKILNLCVKRNKRLKGTDAMIDTINSFIEQLNDDNYNRLIKENDLYINSFTKKNRFIQLYEKMM